MNLKSFLLLLSISICCNVFAQQKQAIRFSEHLNSENARRHLTVLASDAYGGRETGTKGCEMAAEYIGQQFRAMGLKGPVQGGYTQDVSAVRIKLTESLKVNGTVFTPIKNFFNVGSSVK